MEKLSILEQESLEILKQLERCCEGIGLHNPEKIIEDKFLYIAFSDIDFNVLKKTENIYDVAKYLQKNGVNFFIQGNDLIDRFPGMPINKYLPFNNNTQLGIVKGENIQVIETSIRVLINRLSSESVQRVEIVKAPTLRTVEIYEDEDEDETEEDVEEEVLEDKIEISKSVTKKYKDIKLDLRDKRGYLQFEKGGEWIDIGGYNTRTCKMVRYILMPSSKSKKIVDIYEHIKILIDNKNEELQKDTTRSYQMKKEIIEQVVDELQKEEFLKGHINKPIFDDYNKEATIEFK